MKRWPSGFFDWNSKYPKFRGKAFTNYATGSTSGYDFQCRPATTNSIYLKEGFIQSCKIGSKRDCVVCEIANPVPKPNCVVCEIANRNLRFLWKLRKSIGSNQKIFYNPKFFPKFSVFSNFKILFSLLFFSSLELINVLESVRSDLKKI